MGALPRWWYELNKVKFTTLKDLEDASKARYCKQTPRSEHVRKFRTLTLMQGESLTAFRNRLDVAAGKARVTEEEDMVFQFIDI